MAGVAPLLLCLLCSLGCAGALRASWGREAANFTIGDGHEAASFTVRDIRGNEIQYPLVAPSDPRVVQAAYVACGRHACDLGVEAVRSFLAQAKLDGGKRPVLHLFVDEPCAAQMKEYAATEPSLVNAAKIKVYLVSELKLSTELNLYKECASLRLSLPRLLPHLPKLLYMDVDTYVAGPLRRIWDLKPHLWAFAENDFTWYTDGNGIRCPPNWRNFLPADAKGVSKCFYGTSGINSGVMLLNMRRWRELNIDKEVRYWVDAITQHGANQNPGVFMMGDQDIFNLLATVHAEQGYTSLLPCEMNSQYLTRFMCYYGPGNWEAFESLHPGNFLTRTPLTNLVRNAKQPVIIHAKFNINGRGDHCWTDLHAKLRLAVDKVSRGEAGKAKSICEVAGCDMS